MAALTPEVLEGLAQPLVEVYTNLEEELLQNIAKRFNTGKGLATTEWQLKKLAEIGALTQDNLKTIVKYIGQVPALTELALEGAALEALKQVEPLFAEAVKKGYLSTAQQSVMSPSVQQALNNYVRQALDSFNLVNTTMLNSSLDAYRKAITNTVTAENYSKAQSIMNTAAGEVITGTYSRQQALTSAIKKLASEGITAFYDRAGRAWSPEAYVNMDIRTTVTNTAHATTFAKCDDYGVDLIEISSHAGARPKCAVDQGKLYSRNNKTGTTTDGADAKIPYYSWGDTSNGEPDGILGINCGHFASPFFAGLSFKHSEETKDFKENAKQYEQSQQQRQYERDIRAAKREAILQKEAGNQEAYEAAAAKVKKAQEKYSGFCSDAGRTPRPDRAQVVGYDKKMSQDVVKTNNAAIKAKKEAVAAQQAKLDIKHAEVYNKSPVKPAVESSVTPAGYTAFNSAGDIPDWLKQQSASWTYAETEALKYYTGSAYSEINGALRGLKSETAKAAKAIEQISSGISKSTISDNIVAWRGATLRNFTQGKLLSGLPVEKWVGEVISDKAFVSSSLLRDRAFSGKEVFMEILTPKGSSGAYLKDVSQFSSEYELLFQKGSQFQILEATQTGSKYFVKVILKGG
jgi:hypothetical protein